MQSEGSNWSENTLTYSVSVPSSSPSLDKRRKDTTEASCQTVVLWKDDQWHCTQCAKPPLPPDAPSPKSKSSGASPAPDAAFTRESKRRAMLLMEQLQGQWRLCSSSAGSTDCVADWLKVFNIDQHEVLSEDGTMQQLEVITDMKVCLCGGELKLDNLGYLHRHGRSGQHLVFAPTHRDIDEEAPETWLTSSVKLPELS